MYEYEQCDRPNHNGTDNAEWKSSGILQFYVEVTEKSYSLVQSTCHRRVAFVRQQILQTREEALSQLIPPRLQRIHASQDQQQRLVVVLKDNSHRPPLYWLQRLGLCCGETGVPRRTRVLEHRPYYWRVETHQVVTPGAGAFQLLEKMQAWRSFRGDSCLLYTSPSPRD